MPKERKSFDKIFPKEISKDVKELIKHYMIHSNASSAHNDHDSDEEHFAAMFTEDGVYELDGRRAVGRKEIIRFREALFKNIPRRDHPLIQMFTEGKNDLELMGLGEVAHRDNDGNEQETDWATYWSIVRVEGKPLFKKVRIFLMESIGK